MVGIVGIQKHSRSLGRASEEVRTAILCCPLAIALTYVTTRGSGGGRCAYLDATVARAAGMRAHSIVPVTLLLLLPVRHAAAGIACLVDVL